MDALNVTTLEQLREYSAGAVVELPPFAEGQKFVARLKRPSTLRLVSSGKIGNPLAQIASDLFMSSVNTNKKNENLLKEMFDVFEIVAEESLVQPTYKELKEIGLELTDEQLTFLYNYSQRGVQELEGFR